VKIGLAALAALMLVPGTAMAVDYPAPNDPGKLPPRPNGGEATLHVCKKPRCFQSIQQAVNASRSGDTIKVANGTYREGVLILNRRRSGLRIVGNTKNPAKVLLNGKGLKGARAQNGFLVNGVNHVTIKGFKTKNYKANGVFVVNATGYTLTNLIAEKTGIYGIYAFNTKGGSISNSEAFHTSDAGFYIGQTPPQSKPKRTFVKNVRSHSNVIGFSGTNMRYVTIQNSKFWNNGVGIVPNALDTEKFAPPEFNVIKNNEVFWNNFNYYLGAPFELRGTAVGDLAYPPGVGILMFGGRDTIVEGNQLYGNYVAGFAMIDQIVLEQEDARSVDRNTVRGNSFGLNGTDLNGRDIAYDGSGSGNCFADNGATQNNLPADNSELVGCPLQGLNGVNDEARAALIAISTDPDHEKYWVKHPHAPKDGYTPLEHYAG
jgi:Right handed beta helix region